MNQTQVTAALAAVGGVSKLQTVVFTNLGRRVEVGTPAVTSFTFDDANQIVHATLQSGQVEVFGYDQIIELLGVQDANFQTIPFDIWTQVGKQWKP